MTAAIGPPTVKATISSAGGCSPTLRPLVVSALQQAVFSLQLLIAALNRQGSHRSLGYEETLGNLLREAALSPAKTTGYILNLFPLLCQAKSMGPSGNSLYRERKRGWASPTPLSCHVHPCWSRHLSLGGGRSRQDGGSHGGNRWAQEMRLLSAVARSLCFECTSVCSH